MALTDEEIDEYLCRFGQDRPIALMRRVYDRACEDCAAAVDETLPYFHAEDDDSVQACKALKHSP